MNSKPGDRPDRSIGGLLNDLIEVALEAAVRSFLVILLGGIAFSIMGGIMRGMIPTAPPGFEAMTASPASWIGGASWLKGMTFQLVFSVAFVAGLWRRFGRPLQPDTTQAEAGRWRRIGERFAENWFGTLVGNAILASALAGVLLTIPKLSFWHWGWNWLSAVVPAERILGEGWLNELRVWLGWYDSNQLRFTFWAIYLGAVCDDFGLPNYKSLARWLWRKQRNPRRRATVCPAPRDLSPPAPPAVTQTDPGSPPTLTAQ